MAAGLTLCDNGASLELTASHTGGVGRAWGERDRLTETGRDRGEEIGIG